MANLFDTVTSIDLVLSVANLAILVYLLAIYVRLYRQMRQKFTLAFIIFAGLLLFQTAAGTAFLAGHFLHGAPPGGPMPPPPMEPGSSFVDAGGLVFLRLIPQALELVALLILLWITRE